MLMKAMKVREIFQISNCKDLPCLSDFLDKKGMLIAELPFILILSESFRFFPEKWSLYPIFQIFFNDSDF